MDNLKLSQKIKSDILQKIDSINFLATQREKVKEGCINDFLKGNIEVNNNLKTFNQTLSDALLNAMATLIDYYFIYCTLAIGADIGKIRKVQYRNINNKFIIVNRSFDRNTKESVSLEWYKEKINLKIKEASGLPIDKISIHDYWYCYLSDALLLTLCDYGINIPKTFSFDFDKFDCSFKTIEEIVDFNECMLPFYCNQYSNSGVKYNIYLDINNCLKHNTIPYLIYQTETFKKPVETRIFEFFEIENYKSVFLKDGFLKDIVTASFDELKENLKFKKENGNFEICLLEKKWGIGKVVDVDHKNGYFNEEENSLYFFLDGVSFIKKRDSILVDANYSYKNTLSRLFEDIKRGISYFEHKQQNFYKSS